MYLNFTRPDAFYVQRGPRKFEPLDQNKSVFRGEKETYQSYLTPCPTLERLNIANYDKKRKMDLINVKHLSEFIDQYKFDLKTVDDTRIKEHIFRSVYKEILQIDERKNAIKFQQNAPAPKFDEFLDDIGPMGSVKSFLQKSSPRVAKSSQGAKVKQNLLSKSVSSKQIAPR